MIRQICPARINQVNAWQPVLASNLLGPQVLLDGDRVIGPAFDRRVITNHDTFAPGDATDPRDQSRRRRFCVVHAKRSQRGTLEKRAARIEQLINPLARQQLSTRQMTRSGGLAAAPRSDCNLLAQVTHRCLHGPPVVSELCRLRIDPGLKDGHRSRGGSPSVLSEEGFGARLRQVGTCHVIIGMAVAIKTMPGWITMQFKRMTGLGRSLAKDILNLGHGGP